LSFQIYHPKNNVHNQDGNHDDNKVGLQFFFFELTDNDGQNFLAGIVQCVERFKALYDKSSKDFKDGVKKEMIWRQIADKVKISGK
jgi:hypothetical protein